MCKMGQTQIQEAPMSTPYLYWGKAKPSLPGRASWHLLPYHCLDVAAAGIAYLQRASTLREMLSERLNMTTPQLLNWVGFWLALHDLGKFSSTFQGQRKDILQGLQERQSRYHYTVRHDTLGKVYWQDELEKEACGDEWFGPQTHDLMPAVDHWVRAVTGHHGQPPLEEEIGTRTHFERPNDHRAIALFVEQMRALFLTDMDWQSPCFVDAIGLEETSRDLSWWIAGLAVLADWVGSNQNHFPYEDQELSLASYWSRAQSQASAACENIGVLPVHSRDRASFHELFPGLKNPSPLQAWATETPLPCSPQIHLLEDVTGAGKTEAAMMLTHRLMALGIADGFFIGLPTMATANAMYGRLTSFYAKLFAGQASLVLATGQRQLVEAFAASVLPSGPLEQDPNQEDDSASARCTAWLADHNKRALLSPAGVGTIDQALMAVLQGKHQSLRLLGLFRKVLIVDEVHACDAYMQGVLERLLQAHAAAGGSAILLSATLPERMKRAFLTAFAEGCGQPSPSVPAEPAYPLITSWAAAKPDEVATNCVGTRSDVVRTVQARYVASSDEVVSAIRQAVSDGLCVCWMRNTVADAMAAHAMFADALGPDRLLLFHARFTLRDRLDMEGRILTHFGPNSSGAQRRGRLVIATQVAEQSLDADWDWIVSDLAPIDRLIQRAGRLQRHRRDAQGNRLPDASQPDGRTPPCLWVLGPAWDEQPSGNWFKEACPKSSKVYRHHGQLWLTARLLQEGQLRMPTDARRLIESVYGEDAPLPEGLQRVADVVEGEEMSEASQAHSNAIKLKMGYVWLGEQWWSDAKAPTRLGEASRNILLCRWAGGLLQPWATHKEPRHAWAYSTVRVPDRLIAEAVPPTDPEELQAWEAAKLGLPDQGKWSVLLPLKPTTQGWIGQTVGKQGSHTIARQWVYDEQFGLLEIRINQNG
jgi:CRISPR-associated endonuclease/helicase Cas3